MSTQAHHDLNRPVEDLRGSALLLELFLQWGLVARPSLRGWEEYRMCGAKRWLSHNALQGLLEEFIQISGLPPAITTPSAALPHEGIEAPYQPSEN